MVDHVLSIMEWCLFHSGGISNFSRLRTVYRCVKARFGRCLGRHWFSLPCPSSHHDFDIHVLELLAIVAAFLAWGHEWRDKQILFHTDNLIITHVWRSGTSPDRKIMKLVRFLFLHCAQLNINLLMLHIPGSKNVLADPLSRLQVGRFRQLFPEAHHSPSPVPVDIWDILM